MGSSLDELQDSIQRALEKATNEGLADVEIASDSFMRLVTASNGCAFDLVGHLVEIEDLLITGQISQAKHLAELCKQQQVALNDLADHMTVSMLALVWNPYIEHLRRHSPKS